MTFISLLILFNVVLSALQRSHLPHADHFWTWNSPYGFASHDLILRQAADGSASKKIGGGAGHFLALWTAVTTCVFSLVGFETIAVTAPENRDLEKHETIKLASRKLFMRITILYSLCTFAGGLNVPYNDSYLFDIQNNDVHAGQNSIYVLAAVRSRLTGYPHFMNGFFIFSATTSAINGLYNSSRILHAIASIPEAWPIPLQQMRRRLEMTTSRGVPMATILVSWLFGLLAFLAVGRFPSIILGRMSTNAIVSELLVYAVICASYIIFHGRIKKAASDYGLENRAAFDRGDAQYPYRSHGQLARSYYGLAFCVLLIVFNGWRSFVTPFSTPDFIVSYIGIVAFAVIVCLYHIKMDGWNPLNWRRHASMEIFRPPPKAVVPGRRRGVLEIKDEKGSFKVMGLVDWLWCWLK